MTDAQPEGKWPFPGDSPVVRARKIALAYRELALGVTPGKVAQMDERFQSWGEDWHLPQPITYGPGDWLPTQDAALLVQLSVGTLSALRVRGRIKGRLMKKPGRRGFEYLYDDLIKLSTERRGRAWRRTTSTDRVTE